MASYVAFSGAMEGLMLGNAALERLATGMIWAEGPAYFPQGDYVLWSDIPNNRIMQWVPDLGTRVYSHHSNNSNGLTRDPQGRLVVCEHLSRSVVRYEGDGVRTVLADSFADARLNSPNDVVVSSKGVVWFTDPTYGIMSDYEGKRADPEQETCNVYRRSPNGEIHAAVTSIAMPNGLALSLDERTLYVADSSRSHDPHGGHHIHAFALSENGLAENGTIFAEVEHGVPDGLRLDEFGHVWCSSQRGVEVFAPDGRHLGYIKVPEVVSNLTFGGPKRNRLFITATTSLYSIYVAVAGANTVSSTGGSNE